MRNHILVPVVFEHGDRGANALKTAGKLLSSNGKITLFHVMEDIPAYAAHYIPEDIRDHHKEDAAKRLGELAASTDSACEIAVIRGHSSSSILDYCEAHDVDCIVIASHKPGLEDYFLGSTAARVVRHAKCCVHVLR